MHCQKCTQSINVKTDCYIVCEGSCYGAYHAHCVGLIEATVSVLATKNVIWLCDACLATFYKDRMQDSNGCLQEKTHSGSEVEILKEIDGLKAQVASIVSMLSGGAQNSKTVDSSPFNKCSTPISSPNALNTAKSSNSDVGIVTQGSECSRMNSQTSFSLLLSNVDNRVTEEDIDSLVSKSLGINNENVHITKLVPTWKSCGEMDYISFKVVLDEKWKSAAMNASTWPPTIKYREFVNRSRNTWYPCS